MRLTFRNTGRACTLGAPVRTIRLARGAAATALFEGQQIRIKAPQAHHGVVRPMPVAHILVNHASALHVMGVMSFEGSLMSWLRRSSVLVICGGAAVLLPAASASAHVHRITPLLCTPAPSNAGANQTDVTPASATTGGPISGVIPVVRSGGVVTVDGEGFDAAVCTR